MEWFLNAVGCELLLAEYVFCLQQEGDIQGILEDSKVVTVITRSRHCSFVFIEYDKNWSSILGFGRGASNLSAVYNESHRTRFHNWLKGEETFLRI
jgi:hypothetical protein